MITNDENLSKLNARLLDLRIANPPDPKAPPAAFPQSIYDYTQGMTLRDYFAAKALQGFCANPESERTMLDTLAEMAYAAADEMLKMRGGT